MNDPYGGRTLDLGIISTMLSPTELISGSHLTSIESVEVFSLVSLGSLNADSTDAFVLCKGSLKAALKSVVT